jgi:cell division protein FtsL
MELTALVVVSVYLLVWASIVVQRANPISNVEKVLWYIVILSMPIVGALLVFVRFERKTVKPSLEAKMQSEIVEAHARHYKGVQAKEVET